MMRVPDPLEWHPAYADQTWLLDWLNRTGAYQDYKVYLPRLAPKPAAFLISDGLDDLPTDPVVGVRTLTKQYFAGPAPYVGRPFRYTWVGALDEVGRAVCADSTIQYNHEDDLHRWPDLTALPERHVW